MSIKNLLLGGVSVAFLSLIYNYFIFYIFDFYPDLSSNLGFLSDLNVYVVIFVKNLFVGIVLMTFFSLGYRGIRSDKSMDKYPMGGIFFFIMYAIFALISFSLGDIILMQSTNGILVLLTVDGIIESLIATIPVKLFSNKLDLY